MRKASIKETGEELSPAEWARFDAAAARLKAERAAAGPRQADLFGEARAPAEDDTPAPHPLRVAAFSRTRAAG